MIKKIDANKYGVVRYAISSIEDIADLPREVSVGSEAILVNEDGEKKFRLGSDGWVEVVEVKEYDEDKLRDILEDAKVGYGGIEYETLEERLEKDFDNAYSVLDNRTYIEYEGCRITAKDSLIGLQKETVVKGRTLQNLMPTDVNYTGYNITRLGDSSPNHIKGTINHVNFIIWAGRDSLIPKMKSSTVYTVIGELKSNKTIIECNIAITDNVGIKYYTNVALISLNSTSGRFVTKITTDQDLSLDPSKFVVLALRFSIKDLILGEDWIQCDNLILLEGDHTQTPLEELPYIEGIESVGDKSKNLINPNAIIDNIRLNNYGIGVSSDRYISTDFIKIKPNTSYFVTGLTVVFEYDNNKDFIKLIRNTLGNGTFITSSNGEYIRLRNFDFLENKESKQEMKSRCMLHVGTQAIPYQEYYEGYKISGKSCGKNLAKEISEENYVANGNGEVIFENNKCIAMDKSGWASCFISGKETIKVKPNTIYYGMVECEEGAEYLSQMKLIYKCYDKNNNVITTIGTVTMSNNANYFYTSAYNDVYEAFLPIPTHYKYVKFSSEVHSVKLIFRPAVSSGTITNTFKNILFVETNKQPTYEPYKESTYSYILDEPLRSLPNGVCDEIDLEKGVVTRRVGKFVVDGSQVLTRSSTNSNKTKTTHFSVNGISSNSPYGICDKLPTVIDASLQVYEEPCMKFSSPNKINPPYALWLNIDRSNADTVEEAYEYFRNNPHTVWYELETPYIEPINLDEVILDTTRLKSYEPITHITSDNYLPPTIKTEIPSDFNAVVLGLKNNNEVLTSQVMSLRQTNDELETTNREQDDVIDVTLLALDEVYGMIDEGEIETMSVGSPMVNVYVKMIKRGIKTLDEVPSKYRAEVEELI